MERNFFLRALSWLGRHELGTLLAMGGLTAGVWCIGACWALMLLSIMTDALHLPLMAAIAALIFVERAKLAKPARWGFAIPASLRKGDRPARLDVALRANIAGQTGA